MSSTGQSKGQETKRARDRDEGANKLYLRFWNVSNVYVRIYDKVNFDFEKMRDASLSRLQTFLLHLVEFT